MSARTASPELAESVAALAGDRKAADVVILSAGHLFGNGLLRHLYRTLGRHVRAIVERIETGMAERGEHPLAREGVAHGAWALLDYGDVVIHVFQPDSRAFYDLERLWSLALIAACGIFIGIVSIRMGVHHADKDAFWVPILGGAFCVLFFSWMFYRFARYLWHRAKRSDRLRI